MRKIHLPSSNMTYSKATWKWWFSTQLCLTCHATFGKIILVAGPQIPLEMVCRVGTWSVVQFLNLNLVLPGSLIQVLGVLK